MSDDNFDADLDAQLALEVDTFTVEVVVNKKLVTLQFKAVDGLEWADMAAQCPPNLNSSLDMSYGYSLRAMVLLAASVCGVRIVDGEPVETSPEQWTKLLRGLSGAGHRQIGNALYVLNEHLPALAVAAAKKASQVGSSKSFDSPVPSESPLPALSDVNPLSELDSSGTPVVD